MSQISNGSDRRILTFSAVQPYNNIAPATLLRSLIDLSAAIYSYKSKFFASNRRHIFQIIRQVGNLQTFFEEIRENRLPLLNSDILCFSKLHLTFQKILSVFEDCTREGARLWVLIKSDLVSTQFRILIQSVSTALDILKLDTIDVSSESKELILLVIKQVRKASFEIVREDQRVLNEIELILNQFEVGILPHRRDLIRVLNYLGIKTWNDCNKEVKFLDSEIALESLNEEKKEMANLCSLLALMSYCRCVIFDVVNSDTNVQHDNEGSNSVLNYLNPDDFLCPITLELMTDPVTISTGHTYDRSSILKWFKSGNPICPKTGQKLKNTDLVPNLALQRLIQQQGGNTVAVAESSQKNRHKNMKVAGSLAAEQAMKMAANFLSDRLVDGTVAESNKAAYEIRLLTKNSVFNRSCLIGAGVIMHLLVLATSTDSAMQENAMAALLNLSKHTRGKAEMVDDGGLQLIVHVLEYGIKLESRQHAAATLFYISSVDEYRKLIGEIPEAIPGLISLIKDGQHRGKKNSLVAIFSLLMHPANHSRVISEGTVPLLLNLLKSSDKEDLVTDSLAVLATLAEKPDGTTTLLRHKALNQVLEILGSPSTSKLGKEYCVSLLLVLCINGGVDVVSALGKSNSLMGSLYSVLSDGTSRARKKASGLIRVLHEFNERNASGSRMNNAVVHGRQFVQI